MEHHPPHRPVDDPFFAPVRRRHPDVDLVLLDPPAAADGPDPAPTLGTGRDPDEALAAVDTAVRDLLPPDPPARLRFRHGPDEESVVPEARWSDRCEDGDRRLEGLRDELVGRGWQVRRADGGLARLTATAADLALTATWAPGPGALVVTVSGAVVPVGRERARLLVRGQR